MSEFVCKKPITLSGRSFSYGEIIPDGFVLPGRALTLIRSNYITEVENGLLQAEEVAMPILPFQSENGEIPITIPISTENGILEATMSSQTIITAFEIMQKTVEEAEKDIAILKDVDALILLNAADSRKGIKKAAEERNAQLQEIPDNAESGTDNAEGQKTGDA